MKLKFRNAIVAVSVGSVALMGFAGSAGATTVIPNSGQDSINDNFLIGGSDTTYVVESDIASLYNRSPGCATTNSFGGAIPIGACSSPATNTAAAANLNDNWDHDILTNVYPTGSSGGINAAIAGAYDMARSSRVLTAAELATQNAFGFGKDGIAVVTPPGRAVTSLTKTQLQGIYNCSITTWQQITGNAADAGKTIRPYGMNSSSGTYGTFNTWLGIDPNAAVACVNKVGAGATAFFPFENDLKPVLADATSKGFVASDIIWWGSFGEFKSYPYKAQGVSNWSIDIGAGGVAPQLGTIANDTYGITRILYKMAPNTTLALNLASNAANAVLVTTGATSGKAGAARRYTEWSCQPLAYFGSTAAPSANTAVNPYTGASYYEDMTKVISNSGFQRVPSTQRNAGACQIQQ